MFSLDIVALGVPDVRAARAFCTAALSTNDTHQGKAGALDLQGTGLLALQPIQSSAAHGPPRCPAPGFRGYVMSSIVSQPSEVETLLNAAVQGGVKVLKPAKKGFFGGFTAVYQAPDGAIWKLAAPTKKDTCLIAGSPGMHAVFDAQDWARVSSAPRLPARDIQRQQDSVRWCPGRERPSLVPAGTRWDGSPWVPRNCQGAVCGPLHELPALS